MPDVTHDPTILDPGVINNPNVQPIEALPVVRRQGAALVLSGGGALGAFQVGAIKRLWESGYRPDLICGISVGAINAVKLAEGDTPEGTAADRLQQLWDQMADGSLAILRDWAGAEAFTQRLQTLLTQHGAGLASSTALLPPGLSAAVIAPWLAALPGIVRDFALREGGRIHGLHSTGGGQPAGFQGLTDLIRSRIQPDLIAQSGIALRIGMVDLESGSLWMATGPERVQVREPDGTLITEFKARLEREPDLSRSITDAERTRYIDLASATYASTIMPLYFPPLEAREAPLPDGSVEVQCRVPDDFFAFLAGREASTNTPTPVWKHFFDGGLADIVPLRTAMRMGYRDITVISASPLHSNEWTFEAPDSTLERLPLLQYLKGFIGCWATNVARSDTMLALAYNEFLGWLYRAHAALPSDLARRFRSDFELYWRERRPHWENSLGAASWLGGRVPMDPAEVGFEYGRPFMDEGCNIRVIAPRRPLAVDPLGFTDRANLREAINTGYERAEDLLNNPQAMGLSEPVPQDRLLTPWQARERGLPVSP
jgi:predicted acylesterase/phospholipase RssA